ncbi:hypothetical protein BDV11DRAFT_194255 [Aspergillus similis]
MRPRNRDDVTIAIICALTLEADVVEAVFDVTYDRLGRRYGKEPSDPSTYVNSELANTNWYCATCRERERETPRALLMPSGQLPEHSTCSRRNLRRGAVHGGRSDIRGRRGDQRLGGQEYYGRQYPEVSAEDRR